MNLKSTREQLLCGSVSLVLLDINLPDGNGLDFLSELKITDPLCPVILLTANDTDMDIVTGLEQGADDYITKPFGMMELLSRIRALARRTSEKPSTYQCGCLCVDEGRHTVTVEGHETVLTQKEFELLCLLLQNRGQVFSRETIYEQVRGFDGTADNAVVKEHIRRIRNKLGAQYIETVWGCGYKWVK